MSLASGSRQRGGIVGHLVVALSACVLTVSIVGSAVFLVYRVVDRQQKRTQVRRIITALENRTDAELVEMATLVRSRPRLARYILPELLKALGAARSERHLVASIRLARAFVDQPRVEETLFALRRDAREVVAAAAVEALANAEPPERAAERLGACIADVPSGEITDAAVDAACAGLYALGEVGRRAMASRLPMLSVDRRVWLAGYVDAMGGAEREPWLRMLQDDPAAEVRAVATARLSEPDETRSQANARPVQAG